VSNNSKLLQTKLIDKFVAYRRRGPGGHFVKYPPICAPEAQIKSIGLSIQAPRRLHRRFHNRTDVENYGKLAFRVMSGKVGAARVRHEYCSILFEHAMWDGSTCAAE